MYAGGGPREKTTEGFLSVVTNVLVGRGLWWDGQPDSAGTEGWGSEGLGQGQYGVVTMGG